MDVVERLRERPLCTLRQEVQVGILRAILHAVQSVLGSDALSSGDRLYASLFEKLLQTQDLPEIKLWSLLGFLCRLTEVPFPADNAEFQVQRAFSNKCESLVHARERKRKSVSLDEQRLQDQKLFANAGLVMFLDYEATMYLLYVRSGDPAFREHLVNDPVVSMEGFEAPGIRAGVNNDIMITDFLLRLFAPEPRDTLLDACYLYKASVNLMKQFDELPGIMRQFLSAEIKAFRSQGITKLSPTFPAALNVRTLEELTALIETDRHPS